MEINKKILKYLEDKGINHSVLVKKTGISKQNLSRILSSDDIKFSQLIEITKALDLPLTFFIDGKDKVSNEEIENYKERISELEEELVERRKWTKALERHIIGVGNKVSEIRENKNDIRQVNAFLDKIENEGKLLGLVDVLVDVIGKFKGKPTGVAQPAGILSEKAQSLKDKETKSKK
jgi:DNA-binding Xre family transcriptional regulator